MKNKRIVFISASIIALLVIFSIIGSKNAFLNIYDKLLGDVSYPTSNGVKLSCDSNSISINGTTTCTLTGFMTGGASGLSGTLETQGGISLSNIQYDGWNNYGTAPELVLVNESGTTSSSQFIVATMTVTGISNGSATLSFIGNPEDGNKIIISDKDDKSIEVSDATYNITVENEAPALSSDNTLKSLKVGTQDVSLTNPTVTVTNDVNSVSISAVANDSKATVSGDIGTKTLSVGNNSFKITVTAENGAIRTYNLTVIRQQAQSQSTINTLSSLKVGSATLTPSFNSSVTSYTSTVENSITKVNVTATPTDSKATITSGTGDHNLNVGVNEIKVVVKAENGSTKIYTVNVTRKEAEDISDDTSKSKDNKLKSLSVKDATLIPAFDSSKEQNYVAIVSDTVTSVTINAVANDSKASVSFSERLTNNTLSFNANDKSVSLNVIVTAENGSKKYTSLTIMRQSYYNDNKEEIDNNTGNTSGTCNLILKSSVYSIDNEKLLVNNVNSSHSVDTIRSNVSSDCGTIMVNDNKIILSTNDQVKEYTINKVWMPQTGQKVIRYTLIIVVILAAIGGLLFYKKKMNK